MQQGVSTRESLSTVIEAALAQYIGAESTEIVIPENSEKYAERHDTEADKFALDEVFNLMWDLNRQGIEDASIGSPLGPTRSLRDTLDATIAHAARELGATPVRFIELGPEPAKTTHILGSLQWLGTKIDGYTGIDINPASLNHVKSEIANVLSESQFDYLIRLFSDVTAEDCHQPGASHLFTMLGFEEGNDHPAENADILHAMMSPGDLLLTEIQLLPNTGWLPMFEFYATPAEPDDASLF